MAKAKTKNEVRLWRVTTVFSRGKNVRHYFLDTGRGLRRVTKREFERAVSRTRVADDRRQKGKSRNGHAVVPGAGHCWPMRCEALAVHPKQVEQMNARNKRHGVNVTYEPKHGIAIIPDEGAYKRLRKLEGVHLNNSYNM